MLILKRQLIENFIIQRMNRQYNHIIYQINSNNINQEQYDDIIDIVWGSQDQSNCCEGPNSEPNWTECP